MPVDVNKTLRRALARLESEKDRIERQIEAITNALGAGGRSLRRTGRQGNPGRPRRRRVSAATRRAASRRMKAYWAKRKAGATAGKAKSKK